MITRIEALNYRCLKHVAIDVPQFGILIGPNASGKSTLFDAVRVAKDTLNKGAVNAVLSRGRSFRELAWKGQTEEFSVTFRVATPLDQNTQAEEYAVDYALRFGADPYTGIAIQGESLQFVVVAKSGREHSFKIVERDVVPQEFHSATYYAERDFLHNVDLRSPRRETQLLPFVPALARFGLPETDYPRSVWLRGFLSRNVALVSLEVDLLHKPSSADLGWGVFRPDGSNVPHLIESLKKEHPDRFKQWLAHVRTVLDDVKYIIVKEREEDRSRYLVLVQKNGTKVPSWLVSDGTLRFLALTLLAYHPVATGTYLIEEPENGIHPLAIEAVYQSLSSAYDAQILVATHSPMLLSLAKPEEILCFTRDEEGATQIVRASEHPRLRDWKGEVDLSTLYASGVLG